MHPWPTSNIYEVRYLAHKSEDMLADWCDKGLRVISVTKQDDLSSPVGGRSSLRLCEQ